VKRLEISWNLNYFERKAQWNTTEYWSTPLANCCMALAVLLPKEIKLETKLGINYTENRMVFLPLTDAD